MLDPSRPIPIWVVWPYLSWLERLLFIALIVLGVYVLFSAVIAVLRVRKAGALRDEDSRYAQRMFAALRTRSARVDKLITTALYLFGTVLFLGLQASYFTIGDGKAPVGWSILRGFETHFAFAANVFFVFLLLHIGGWFISYSVGKLALQTAPRHAQ